MGSEFTGRGNARGWTRMAPCPVCRSTRFRRGNGGGGAGDDEESAFFVCESGHVNRSYREEEGDFEDFAGGRAFRATSSQSTQKRPHSQAMMGSDGPGDASVSGGAQSAPLTPPQQMARFLEVFQLLLRRQVRVLVHEHHVAPELEVIGNGGITLMLGLQNVVRELWVGYLQCTDVLKSLERASAGAASSVSIFDPAPAPAPAPSASFGASQGEQPTPHRSSTLSLFDVGGSSSSRSATLPLPVPPELMQAAELQAQQQEEEALLDEMEQQESTVSFAGGEDRKGRKPWWLTNVKLTLSLVLCYLGCVFLKEPVLPHDLCRLAANNQIPFLHCTNVLPPWLLRSLPKTYRSVFKPNTIPSGNSVHRWASEIARHMAYNGALERFSLPSINSPLLISRFLTELSLPALLLPCVLRLLEFETQPLYLNVIAAPLHHPCHTVLVAWLIIAVKLVYDIKASKSARQFTKKRSHSSDPFLSSLPSYSAWRTTMFRNFNIAGSGDKGLYPLTFGQAQSMPKDAWTAYLKFCESLLATEAEQSDNSSSSHTDTMMPSHLRAQLLPDALSSSFSASSSGTSQPFSLHHLSLSDDATLPVPMDIVPSPSTSLPAADEKKQTQQNQQPAAELLPSANYVAYAPFGSLTGAPRSTHAREADVAGDIPSQALTNLSNLILPVPDLVENELPASFAELIQVVAHISGLAPSALVAYVWRREHILQKFILAPSAT